MVDAVISPKGHLDLLTATEVAMLNKSSKGHQAELLRRCALAVLSCGSHADDSESLMAQYPNFSIDVISKPRGVQIQLKDAPDDAFVDGDIILGIRDHLFAVLRDIIYVSLQVPFWLDREASISDIVFRILRNAKVLEAGKSPNLVVCWGGHSISGDEYDYTKEVGYRLGLRGMDICTGCGAGAMKGPMKGAAIAHAKQRFEEPRYIGLSEPGIIAAEAPNAIVNQLVIMPDIEKRLEAFVRLGHGIVVFPGGAGTAEEILYILGVMLDEKNAAMRMPLVFTGPSSAKAYFESLDNFIGITLGEKAQALYTIVIDDPVAVSRLMRSDIDEVYRSRQNQEDAYHFNWNLHIPEAFQYAFEPTHASMAALPLHKNQPIGSLACAMRQAFSGIVAGNIKSDGVALIRQHGVFKLNADPELVEPIADLLASFVDQGRMKISGKYEPCYTINPV